MAKTTVEEREKILKELYEKHKNDDVDIFRLMLVMTIKKITDNM